MDHAACVLFSVYPEEERGSDLQREKKHCETVLEVVGFSTDGVSANEGWLLLASFKIISRETNIYRVIIYHISQDTLQGSNYPLER